MKSASSKKKSPGLATPHGGKLINLMASAKAAERWRARQKSLPTLVLDSRALADVEMLANGGFSPLQGFMKKADYHAVVERMHLANGLVWTIPISLGVSKQESERFKKGQPIGLLEGSRLIAILHLEEKYPADPAREALQVYRTQEAKHPGVSAVYAKGEIRLGGRLEVLELPAHSDFKTYRLTPAEVRQAIAERGWKRIVGFQTRNPVHRAHEYLTKTALESCDGLLLHPLVGVTKPDDIPASTRMKSYEVLVEHYYPKDRVILALNPANMHYAGPREAVLHALIRKNFGCTHFIVGRDHAGVGTYYGPYEAQKIFEKFSEDELGIRPLFYENSFYCKTCEGMASEKTCPHGDTEHVSLSGTQVRELLSHKQMPPREFSRPEVAQVLIA